MSVLKTIRAKLLFAMMALATIAAVVAVVGIFKINDFNNRLNFITDSATKRILYSNHAEEAAQNVYRFQKNHILETDSEQMRRWEDEMKKADAEVKANFEGWSKVASEEGKKKIVEAERDYAEFLRFNAEVIALDRQGQHDAARVLSKTDARAPFDSLMKALDEGQALAEKFMDDEAKATDIAYANTRNLMLAVSIIGIGLCLGAAFVIVNGVVKGIREIVDRIKDVAEGEGDLTKRIEVRNEDELGELSGWFNTFMDKLHDIISQVAMSTEHIASATEEISSSATQVAQGAETQKDQTTQVATAMQEMSSTVLQVSDNSNKAAESAKRAGELAKDGGKVVGDTVSVIRTLADSTRETAEKIQALGESSHKIGQIIGVIDDIADQTNLLALNAAIEAARAGEQGRGFAVVADEVRKLAERTTQATKEIAQMITTIQTETQKAVQAMESGTHKVDAGVNSATSAGQSLQEIINASEQVGDMIIHIATAATQQSSATEQVNGNMEQIATLVRESAVGAQQAAKACADLSNLALDLQQLVGRFKLGESSQQRAAQQSRRPAKRGRAAGRSRELADMPEFGMPSSPLHAGSDRPGMVQ